MPAPGWILPPSAWRPIGRKGDRALRHDAQYEQALERTPERTRKRSKSRTTKSWSSADQSAEDRDRGHVALNGADLGNLGGRGKPQRNGKYS